MTMVNSEAAVDKMKLPIISSTTYNPPVYLLPTIFSFFCHWQGEEEVAILQPKYMQIVWDSACGDASVVGPSLVALDSQGIFG